MSRPRYVATTALLGFLLALIAFALAPLMWSVRR